MEPTATSYEKGIKVLQPDGTLLGRVMDNYGNGVVVRDGDGDTDLEVFHGYFIRATDLGDSETITTGSFLQRTREPAVRLRASAEVPEKYDIIVARTEEGVEYRIIGKPPY